MRGSIGSRGLKYPGFSMFQGSSGSRNSEVLKDLECESFYVLDFQGSRS